jgi:hypothetical protein
VFVEGHETGYDDIVDLKPQEVYGYRKAQEWEGEYKAQDEFSGNVSAGCSKHWFIVAFGELGLNIPADAIRQFILQEGMDCFIQPLSQLRGQLTDQKGV